MLKFQESLFLIIKSMMSVLRFENPKYEIAPYRSSAGGVVFISLFYVLSVLFLINLVFYDCFTEDNVFCMYMSFGIIALLILIIVPFIIIHYVKEEDLIDFYKTYDKKKIVRVVSIYCYSGYGIFLLSLGLLLFHFIKYRSKWFRSC